MKKIIIHTMVGVLSMGILSSCGNKSDSDAVKNNATTTEQTEPQKENNTSIKTGVFVDLESIDNPLFNKDIKTLLQTTLNSLANKKEQEFRSVFKDEMTADAFMYLFGKDYVFDEIGTIEEDTEGRIVAEIKGKVVSDNEVTTPNSYYYFVKDKNEKWNLGSID
ncbi:hypothetical protein SAMN05428961_11317 [Paenibacillus sp. OK060]|uniref:hypothetical protein n=1 Tax=Paenibacillus sp. OK060 TaxID=1881034 RepID=UPI00089108D0|nr:hypothetical protein [Paenibacillus sp. OK060]SDM29773.1 hypothetical protein SAMN05428961_11317 [Paenibacillus sp. OK060]